MASTDDDMKEVIDELWRPIGPNDADRIELQKLVELGRQQAVEVFSKSPLHQERARKNPEYWKTMGLMGMWPKEGRIKECSAEESKSSREKRLNLETTAPSTTKREKPNAAGD